MTRFKWSEISAEYLQNIVDESYSLKEVLNKLGRSESTGGNYDSLRKYVKEHNIQLSSLEDRRGSVHSERTRAGMNIRSIESLFVENSDVSRNILRNRILREGLLEYNCSECGLEPIWKNKKLSLQLDHINGVNNDNRIENLRFLCPNCHSQTDSYAGKANSTKAKNKCKGCEKEVSKSNKTGYCRECFGKFSFHKRKVEDRPEKEELLRLVENLGFSGAGRFYGVSDNSIRNWLK